MAKEVAGVRAKLAAYKEANKGDRPVTLKKTGIVCSVPNFVNHGLWMKAQRVAGGDTAKAQAAFICETVKFEGEKFTLTDLMELVPAPDNLQLIGELFGDDEKVDEEGNANAPTVN